MAVEVNLLEDGIGVEIIATGTVTGREIIQAHKKIYDINMLHGQRYHIIDKSKCTEYDVTAHDIEIIAELDKQAAAINPKIVIAIVESESLHFSLTKLWQAHVDDYVFKTKSFLGRGPALEWIDRNRQE